MFLALVVCCAALAVLGCRSMPKHELAERLLALDKNAPVRAAGLETLTAAATIAGERVPCEFTYHHAGERGRPVLVLVHGTPSSLFTWTELVHGDGSFNGLASDFDVYALDVVGHAATRTELDTYSFQACADWVSAFLDALALTDVTLAGQSYGGEFAWRAALDRPQRVARVVLMDSSGVPREDGEWLPEEVKLREWSVARYGWILNSRSRMLGALQPHFAEPVPAERLEEYYLPCCNASNWHAMVDLCRDENGARVEELAKLAQPVLLLWGARDFAYPHERFAQEFARRLPNARLELVPAGHYPHEENPAEVARAIRAFAGAAR